GPVGRTRDSQAGKGLGEAPRRCADENKRGIECQRVAARGYDQVQAREPIR
ncbi:hypothetical protein RUM43_006053, partial [Polyplax serrata]